MVRGATVRLDFFVQGKPVPDARSRTRGGQHYTPARVRQWRETVLLAWFQAQDCESFEGPVCLVLGFAFTDKRKRDLDNLAKAVMDALNGAAWLDDSQIVDLHIRKSHTDNAEWEGVKVEISDVGGASA